MARLKAIHEQILAECWRRQERLKGGRPAHLAPGYLVHRSAAEGYRLAGRRMDFEEQLEIGPRYSGPEWFPRDCLTDADRQRYLRAVERLVTKTDLLTGTK